MERPYLKYMNVGFLLVTYTYIIEIERKRQRKMFIYRYVQIYVYVYIYIYPIYLSILFVQAYIHPSINIYIHALKVERHKFNFIYIGMSIVQKIWKVSCQYIRPEDCKFNFIHMYVDSIENMENQLQVWFELTNFNRPNDDLQTSWSLDLVDHDFANHISLSAR